jgi:hypothetical protein
MVGESAIVDLGCFHPGPGKWPVFEKVESRLTLALTDEFGTRLTMPVYPHQAPFDK